MEKEKQLDNKHLDLVVIFDNGLIPNQLETLKFLEKTPDLFPLVSAALPFEFRLLFMGMIGAMTRSVLACIEQEIPVIVSPPLFVIILEHLRDNPLNFKMPAEAFEKYIKIKPRFVSAIDNLKKNWKSYISKDHDFIVLMPQSLIRNNSLSLLGFDENNLDNLWDIDILKLPLYKDISIDSFKKLFLLDAKIRKRIILQGHGTSQIAGNPESAIAELSIKKYNLFLEAINQYCDFLYVISCYAGGMNMIEAQKEQYLINKKIFERFQINYPIVLGSALDAPSTLDTLDYKAFFNKLDAYLANPTMEKLKETLKEAYKTMNKLLSIPLIRFPGSNSLFRAVELDKKIALLTVAALKAYELKFKMKGASIEPYQLEGQKVTLLYPSLINIPLALNIDKLAETRILSMIPGTAIHMIDSLEMPNSAFTDIFEIFNQESLVQKIFYIKKLICKDGIYEYVLFSQIKEFSQLFRSSNFSVITKISSSQAYPSFNNQFVGFQGTKDQFSKDLMPLMQKVEDYMVMSAYYSYFMATPSADAIEQSTGGQQTLEMLKNAIENEINVIYNSTKQ